MGTLPILGSIVQKGQFSEDAFCNPNKALNYSNFVTNLDNKDNKPEDNLKVESNNEKKDEQIDEEIDEEMLETFKTTSKNYLNINKILIYILIIILLFIVKNKVNQ